jgi:hypothetical protein
MPIEYWTPVIEYWTPVIENRVMEVQPYRRMWGDTVLRRSLPHHRGYR